MTTLTRKQVCFLINKLGVDWLRLVRSMSQCEYGCTTTRGSIQIGGVVFPYYRLECINSNHFDKVKEDYRGLAKAWNRRYPGEDIGEADEVYLKDSEEVARRKREKCKKLILEYKRIINTLQTQWGEFNPNARVDAIVAELSKEIVATVSNKMTLGDLMNMSEGDDIPKKFTRKRKRFNARKEMVSHALKTDPQLLEFAAINEKKNTIRSDLRRYKVDVGLIDLTTFTDDISNEELENVVLAAYYNGY